MTRSPDQHAATIRKEFSDEPNTQVSRDAESALDELVARVTQAEAELARLREERDDWKGKAEFAGMPAWERLWNQKEAAEARCARLQQALEQIASDIHPARPEDKERPRWLHENSVWWNHYSPQEIARDALAGPDTPAKDSK